MANRLVNEKSAYLQQHAQNPVDWYPWGSQALAAAQEQNKPILLSIGYSACHWCHVMEHESFENPEVAELMNQYFINIKVDREERPDLDQIYQNVAQVLTRSGGWPLTVFLTPTLEPFFGGTYFPPSDSYGRPGFKKILTMIGQTFQNDLQQIQYNAQRLTAVIKQIENQPEAQNTATNPTTVTTSLTSWSIAQWQQTIHQLLNHFDWKQGGFGDHPKFPQTTQLKLLWRFAEVANMGLAEEAVVQALSRMAAGGIYDHLGGGFHRYSVDEAWQVPHFEKMLYDNALLLQLYAEVALNAKTLAEPQQKLFNQVITQTLQYLIREMKHPSGLGWISSQDADSEGQEGKFFVWSYQELAQHLTPAEFELFSKVYGVTEQGNFEHSQQTVLAIQINLAEYAAVYDQLTPIKQKLFKIREQRPKPFSDHKRVSSLNGLMLNALVWSLLYFKKNQQTELAAQTQREILSLADFFTNHAIREQTATSIELTSVIDSSLPASVKANLEDYAYWLQGWFEALRITQAADSELSWPGVFSWAQKLLNTINLKFSDQKRLGYFFTASDHEELLIRPKSLYDQAIPNASMIIYDCQNILAHLTSDQNLGQALSEKRQELLMLAQRQPFGLAGALHFGLRQQMGLVTYQGLANHLGFDSDPEYRLVAARPYVYPLLTNVATNQPPTTSQLCYQQTCYDLAWFLSEKCKYTLTNNSGTLMNCDVVK